MKWFKHLSTARNDERIAKLEDRAGLEGYGFYFKMLEIVAEAIDASDRCDVTYSLSRWARQTNISTRKFTTLAQCCSELGLMSVQTAQNFVTVKIPKLLKHRDNHTKNLQVTCKQDKDKDIYKEEVDKDKDKKPIKAPPTGSTDNKKHADEMFNQFYAAYPKKVARADAQKAWSKIKPCLYQKIIDDTRHRSENHEPWLGDKKFINAPAVWLNGKRWDDEIILPNSPSKSTGPNKADVRLSSTKDAMTSFVGNTSSAPSEQILLGDSTW